MMTRNRLRKLISITAARRREPRIALALLFVTAPVPLLALMLLVPLFLVLPALSLASITIAGLVALWAWGAETDADHTRINLWDISGACALIGFSAGMLSDPEQAMELVHSSPPTLQGGR